MPRKSRIISIPKEQEDIIKKSECCYVGMVDENNNPYVLPFNFGYKDQCIYLHSAPNGKKIDILKKNNRVCLVFSIDHELFAQNKDVACSYSMGYKSVICYGKVEFIEGFENKVEALNIFMQQYTQRDFKYSVPAVNNVMVYKVVIDKMTGREFGNLP
ncbi:MAG TPA: pyridoxamine 5'-phosphate oxidase family protein [Bacteroidales bacterium]|nr:pyridoxamine 5'-phosphate oxidase family protein [Bacteroidales bacterium]